MGGGSGWVRSLSFLWRPPAKRFFQIVSVVKGIEENGELDIFALDL